MRGYQAYTKFWTLPFQRQIQVLADTHLTNDDLPRAQVDDRRYIQPALLDGYVRHVGHKSRSWFRLLKLSIQHVLQNSAVRKLSLLAVDSIGTSASHHRLTANFPHYTSDLVVPGLAFMSVLLEGGCHPQDSVSSVMCRLDAFDAIAELLIFSHSRSRLSKTSIIGAPCNFKNIAGLGKG